MQAKGKSKIISFIFFIIISISFAYWAENINVTVYSKDGLPMSNVNVSVLYQSTGCNVHSEISKLTNSSGMASFSFMNTVDESFGNCVERIYTITASFGGYTNSTIGQVDKKEKSYQLWLPFILHVVNVKNAVNSSVKNATVIAYGISYQTDISGNAYIILPAAMISNFEVSYGNVKKISSANPSLRKMTNVYLPIYDLKVGLTDENGNPLVGIIRYGEEEKILNESYVIFKGFSDLNPKFYVTVNNITKLISSVVTSDNLILRYDTSPPIITNVEKNVKNNKLYITATVVDGGKFSSGISSYPILSFTSNISTVSGQKMFFIGNNKYETSIPLEGEEIKFTIIATDVQGNSANYSDTYLVSFNPVIEIEKTTREFSWITFVGIIVFVIIIYVIYLKIREQIQ